MTLYATKGGLNFSRVGFFEGGRLQHIYISGDLCLTFYITFTFDFLFVF